MAMSGLPWEIVDNCNLPTMRIHYEYLKMSNYEYSRVGLRVPRDALRQLVVDRRSTTILDGSVTVLSRPHYSVWRLSKITYDCRRMKTFHQDCNDDWQRWMWKFSYDFNANLIYMWNIYSIEFSHLLSCKLLTSCGCQPWTGPELFAKKSSCSFAA